MSELPSIDPNKVAQKLLALNSDLTYTKIQLEILAESLRDERDKLRLKVIDLDSEIARLSPVDENPEEV